jgi:hypothetical protein
LASETVRGGTMNKKPSPALIKKWAERLVEVHGFQVALIYCLLAIIESLRKE